MYGPKRSKFGDLIPFHIVVDERLNVIQAGKSLLKAMGDQIIGQPFESLFEIARPANREFSSDMLRAMENTLFVARDRKHGIQLKGQWVAVEGEPDKFCFVCMPLIFDLSAFTSRGLGLQDLALHDATIELTTLVKTTEMALADSKKHAQKLAEQSKRLDAEKAAAEAASAAKSAFLATVSHEVRTPMNGILGMASLLSETALDDVQRNHLDIIQMSGATLLELLNDILDLSKIEAGKLELVETDFDVALLLQEIEMVWQPRFADHGLEFVWNVDPDLPQILNGDPGRIRQILFNYLSNALKFTDAGRVEVCATIDRVENKRLSLKFSVTDTGAGIPADRLGDLFKSFSQLDSSATREYGGTGLGLAISKHLARMMGGAVGVESVPGRGSTFWASVVCGVVAARAAVPRVQTGRGASLSPADSRSLHILVAEDNKINQAFIRALLERWGHRVTLVGNGQEALDCVAACSSGGEDKFDLVLMDVQMPHMDGVTATKHIRRLEGQPGSIPIIAVTANAMVGDRERYVGSGMDDYVSKPIEPRSLHRVIERVLGKGVSQQGASNLPSGEDRSNEPSDRSMAKPLRAMR